MNQMNFIVSLPPNFFIINQKQIKMRINSEIRALARRELHDNWTNPVLATLIYTAISAACGSIPFASLLVAIPLGFGLSIAMLKFIRGDKDNVIDNMFGVFKTYGRTLGVSLLTAVFTFLWTLLFIIPGIIKHYSYAMTFYIANDHPELSADDCIEESMKMMDGHKMDLFLLDLSFIGWALLCLLFTFGIGFLWLNPYIQASHAIFYKELKAELYPEMEDTDASTFEEDMNNGTEFTAEFEN
jgi:uncharacterized membrane protein